MDNELEHGHEQKFVTETLYKIVLAVLFSIISGFYSSTSPKSHLSRVDTIVFKFDNDQKILKNQIIKPQTRELKLENYDITPITFKGETQYIKSHSKYAYNKTCNKCLSRLYQLTGGGPFSKRGVMKLITDESKGLRNLSRIGFAKQKIIEMVKLPPQPILNLETGFGDSEQLCFSCVTTSINTKTSNTMSWAMGQPNSGKLNHGLPPQWIPTKTWTSNKCLITSTL